jgi:hypothetical protein
MNSYNKEQGRTIKNLANKISFEFVTKQLDSNKKVSRPTSHDDISLMKMS